MLRALAVLAVLSLTPAAAMASEAGTSEMCDAVTSVLATAPDFTALRGAPVGDHSWAATISLPGGVDCEVDDATDYSCNFDLDGEGVESPAATSLTDSLLACMPDATRAVAEGRAYLFTSNHIRMVLIWFAEMKPHYYLILHGQV